MIGSRERRWAVAALATVMAIGPATVHAQTPGAPTPASLRVEWQPRTNPWLKPAVEGYVYNSTRYRIGSIRLTVELLDAQQQVVGQRTVWVYGNVPAGDRGFFTVPMLPGDSDKTFRISVESFVLIAIESP